MRVVSHPEAKQELEAEALWYDQRTARFGRGIPQGVRSHPTADRSRTGTLASHSRGDNRKLNFHRFPYAIVYSLREETLFIKAVMHLRRRPFYWQARR